MSQGPPNPIDPRVEMAHNRTGLASFRTELALDRTILAWLRTTLTIPGHYAMALEYRGGDVVRCPRAGRTWAAVHEMTNSLTRLCPQHPW